MRVAALILLLLCPFASSTQAQDYLLWPIRNAQAGDNILLRPQDLLDHESNFCTLVIGAPEGTEVIAPADGEVSGIFLTYMSDLVTSRTYGYDDAKTFDAMRQKLDTDPDVRDPKKFINGKNDFQAIHPMLVKPIIYILTNENSASAATDFPEHLVRAGRARTVGRETATAYHYMTALKFARFFLPNSHIEYQLPLVKAVTATNISGRFPYGRGLLPDYEVPLTREEIFSSTEDIILNHALEIIYQKK